MLFSQSRDFESAVAYVRWTQHCPRFYFDISLTYPIVERPTSTDQFFQYFAEHLFLFFLHSVRISKLTASILTAKHRESNIIQ